MLTHFFGHWEFGRQILRPLLRVVLVEIEIGAQVVNFVDAAHHFVGEVIDLFLVVFHQFGVFVRENVVYVSRHGFVNLHR